MMRWEKRTIIHGLYAYNKNLFSAERGEKIDLFHKHSSQTGSNVSLELFYSMVLNNRADLNNCVHQNIFIHVKQQIYFDFHPNILIMYCVLSFGEKSKLCLHDYSRQQSKEQKMFHEAIIIHMPLEGIPDNDPRVFYLFYEKTYHMCSVFFIIRDRISK